MRDKILAFLVLGLAVVGLGFLSAGEKPAQLFRVYWGNLGAKLAEAGVIDASKFPGYYDSEYVEINPENSKVLLNTLWALGLGNKNEILEMEMMDSRYGGAGNFASTGGWTLARGSAMAHYNMHEFITLTPEQQALVDRVSRNIYRPCCGNSTHFPDCNHGMAMLGFLELMASQNAGEEEMYRSALALNSLWFPDTYETIEEYKKQKGIAWDKIDPKEVLGAEYSSGRGFKNISAQVVKPQGGQGGGSCGVN